MNRKIEIGLRNANTYFYLQSITSIASFDNYDCGLPEYNEYLFRDALRSLNDHIAFTWLLTEQSTGKTAAYMSLIMDAINIVYRKGTPPSQLPFPHHTCHENSEIGG